MHRIFRPAPTKSLRGRIALSLLRGPTGLAPCSLIRIEQGASTAGKPKAGESDKMKAKRKSFKARHGKNIARGKLSAAYWADKVKW